MKHSTRILIGTLATLALGGCAPGADDLDPVDTQASAVSAQGLARGRFRPRRDEEDAPRPAAAAASGTSATATSIAYHGGRVMTGTVHAYYIYYGNWTLGTASSSTNVILEDFARSVGGSSYYAINRTYPQTVNGAREYVSGNVTFGGRYLRTNTASNIVLSDPDISNIVKESIDRGALPLDTSGVYFVIAAPNVTQAGMCTDFCGWHDHGTVNGYDLKFSFIGNAGECLDRCAPSQNQSVSPNANVRADAMVSVIAHELDEAVSDPQLGAWYFNDNGAENADRCAWTFGTTYGTSNGGVANLRLGSRDFLIQRNWQRNAFNTFEGCTLTYR
ncbi:MAG: hypothetical protein U0324_46780 [Polyangiales bacterium]